MVTIYAIEDINDLIYVGSTKLKLNKRLDGHRGKKRIRNDYCSSSKLNLEYCIIYELEKCEQKDRKETEAYWIENLQSVNKLKLNFNEAEWFKKYQKKNRDKLNKYQRDRYWKIKSM